MKKPNALYKISSFILVFLLFVLTGCAGKSNHLTDGQPEKILVSEEIIQTAEASIDEFKQTTETTIDEVQPEIIEPIIEEVDCSSYFDGINGAAVIYDLTENCYQIYNQELALTRRSPCSTFKIISSLIALKNGIIEPNNSTRTWNGEIFWNEDWNKDIDFSDAFHASCVWYFREVIDEIGADNIQEELNKLQYGNCDISDWSGELNTNNNNPALTGFWIESSLLISPKEQVEVMERIFGDSSEHPEETQDQLKQVMLLSAQNDTDISIYGKTGMGKAHGIVVDSWFTGFADSADKRIYYCVYLGETADKEVSSAKAKEIAIKIVLDYLC